MQNSTGCVLGTKLIEGASGGKKSDGGGGKLSTSNLEKSASAGQGWVH